MRRVLLWFKQDLRLDDHPALQAARGADALLPVYILDPAQLQPGPFGSRGLGVHRARFLLESLAALDGALRQRGSQLLVLSGRAEQVIAQLAERFNLQEVLTLEEIAPQECQQLQQLRRQLGSVELWEQASNGLLRRDQLPCPVAEPPAACAAVPTGAVGALLKVAHCLRG